MMLARHAEDPFRIGRYLERTEDTARFVVADRSNPGSIASVVSRARENAQGVREWLTLELWEEINAFHLELSAMDRARALEARPYALCELIRRRCETIVAVATHPEADLAARVSCGGGDYPPPGLPSAIGPKPAGSGTRPRSHCPGTGRVTS